MKHAPCPFFLIIALSATLSLVTSVQAQDIRWGGMVSPTGSERENILHGPDHRYTAVDPSLTVSSFVPGSVGILNTEANVFPSTMHYSGLAGLLGVSDAILAQADVIAFEGNGGGAPGPDGGWESSDWTFTDGINVRNVRFNELVGAFPSPGSDPSVIATGSITSSAYSAFFGMCSSDLDNPVISYILFDLHSKGTAIDTRRPGLSITVANGSGGQASPDVDAIGVFVPCRTK